MNISPKLIEYQEAKQSQTGELVRVRMYGKTLGAIKKVGDGFAYFPKPYRKDKRGDVFNTIAEVKRSLEAEG